MSVCCHPGPQRRPEVSNDGRGSRRGGIARRKAITRFTAVPEFLVSHVAQLLNRAAMSASYKPALLKALVRCTRLSDDRLLPLEAIGNEFAKMYWNQTVIFHLRQAVSLTKEAEVIKAIRGIAQIHGVRRYAEIPDSAKATLRRTMARILPINVLIAFHASKPASMPPLYQWSKKQPYIELSPQALSFLKIQGLALETVANYHWADFLEATNRLAPRIIQKVKREGARRGSLAPFLKLLSSDGEETCFYCGRTFDETVRPTVDHVIPWSFLVDDPLWDLVLACGRCNGAKSDLLPDPEFIDKLVRRNLMRARKNAGLPASMLSSGEDVMRLYNAAISVEWPAFWSPA